MTFKACLLAIGATVSMAAQAGPVAAYDVTNANLTGFGGWGHTYTGTITPTGEGLANYTDGSGSLNDGSVADGVYVDNQLFWLDNAPTITLHLEGPTKVSSVQIHGGNTNSSNYIPGMLTGWSVTIGGQSVALSSSAFGSTCYSVLCSDSVSLLGTGLENIETDTLVLSNFQGGWEGYFSASEVTINAVSNVPEPESLALMLAGMAALGGLVQQRRRAR